MVLAGLGVAGIGALALVAAGGGGDGPAEVFTARVKKTRLDQRVRASGHVEPGKKLEISTALSGDLRRVLVRDGQRVSRGEVLAEIDPGPAELVARQRSAQARGAQAQVQIAQNRLEAALEAEAIAEGLHRKGLASDTELSRARREAGTARAEVTEAVQGLDQAEAARLETSARLARGRIVAPVNGVVLALHKREGERVRGSDFYEDVVLTLSASEGMEVEVEVSEHDVAALEVGQPASILIPALQEGELSGKVAEVASSATIHNRGQPSEVTRFKVRVALDAIPPKLRSGMTGTVTIVARVLEDVLAVPFEAVTTRLPAELSGAAPPAGGENTMPAAPPRPVPVVLVVEGGRIAARPVTTGLASDTHLEIKSGLQDGELVVVGPYLAVSRTLMPGMEVQVAGGPGTGEDAVPAAAEAAR